uniref:Uncharacterized protein n=1 Tax=Magallana gigas TaxID=29159 RepID=K1Q1A9_MAGGI
MAIDDKKHLEDKKKAGELNFTFKDASVVPCSSKPLSRQSLQFTPHCFIRFKVCETVVPSHTSKFYSRI